MELIEEAGRLDSSEVPSDLAGIGRSARPSILVSRIGFPRRPWWQRVALPAGVALAACTVVLWTIKESVQDPYAVVYSTNVQEAVDQASSSPGLVLVGGEGAADRRPTPAERGDVGSPNDMDLQEIARGYGERGTVEHGLEVVSGYLALKRIQTAGRFLQVVKGDHPGDPRVRLLEGILAWKNQEPPEDVDRLFAQLIRDHPGYGTARLDYAIILREQGRSPEARALFRDLIDSAGDTPLGRRASHELVTLD